MTDPKQLQAIVQSASPDLELAFKPMFGGIMVYAGGKPFASLSDVGLALKLTGAAREDLLALPGAAALRYEPDAPVSKTYVVVPAQMLTQPDVLRGWIGRSAAAAPTPAKRAAKPRKG
jgi:TfoX/Sxy family transcriptional regulator of competence genes